MQIGKKGASKGNKDTANVKEAADTFVYSPTNELFVADGYGNRRIIVFDADTGAFKRMWGAFGNEPLDNVPAPPKVPEDQRIPAKEATGDGPDAIRARRCTRCACRTTVSSTSPTAAASACRCSRSTANTSRRSSSTAIARRRTAATARRSPAPPSRTIPSSDSCTSRRRSPARVWVLDRKTLEPLDSFGRHGVAPGEFYVMHHMNVDSKGNLYVTEVQDGKRVQKFVFKGMKQVSVANPQ